MANLQSYESADLFYDDLAKIKRGDIIGVKGYPTRTKTGELSIVPRKLELLSPCLHAMPHFYGLKDKVNSLTCVPALTYCLSGASEKIDGNLSIVTLFSS